MCARNLSLIFPVAVAFATAACDIPDLPPNEEGLSTCGPGDVLGGRILSTKTFVRDHGKPVDEKLWLNTDANEDVCIIITTDHSNGFAVPASLTLELDAQQVFVPSDFDAHPKHLSRRVGVQPGKHELTVQLRGKPGGRAVVTVISAPSAGEIVGVLDPIDVARLEDPQADETIVIDETIVVTNALANESEFFAALADLPEPAFVTSRLTRVPIYQVYLPGASGGTDLRTRIEAIENLDMVKAAGVHRVGGIDLMSLPTEGDEDYITHGYEWSPQEIETHVFSSNSWHLERINAGRAWTWMASEKQITVHAAVMDNGFNVEHPDLTDNLDRCWDRVGRRVVAGDCSAGTLALAQDTVSRRHGTAVFGLFSADGENATMGQFANAVGVVWGGGVDIASFNTLQTFREINSQIEFDEDLEPADFGTLLTIEQIIRGPNDGNGPTDDEDDRRLVNMSFGNSPFVGNQHVTNIDLNELEDEIDLAREIWRSLLEGYPDVLLVVAAGNYGDRCPGNDPDNINDPLYCTTEALRGPCTLAQISNQVLCVQESGSNDHVTPGTSHGGDPLAAPSSGIGILEYEGALGTSSTTGTSTSYAAPQVTGAAAILWTLYPDLSPGDIQRALIDGAHPIGGGVGRLDISGAIHEIACHGDYDVTQFHQPSFYDLDEHWSEGPVEFLAGQCIIEGYPDGRFQPDVPINREEALKIILELSQPDVDFRSYVAGTLPEDVKSDAWFAGYLRWAGEHGPGEQGLLDAWLDGQGNFNAGTPVQRGSFIRLLVEAATLSSEPEFVTLANVFGAYQHPDVDDDEDVHKVDYTDEDTPAYIIHEDHIDAASARCIVEGYSQTDAFEPTKPLRRGEAAKVACLARYGLSGGCAEELNIPCIPYTP